MIGEQETIAPVEAETPSEKAIEPHDPGMPEGEEPEGGDEIVEDDGLDDLEWEGVKARVPRDLKSQLEERLGNFSKHFTTKSQELAANLKEQEQGRETIAQQLKASEEEMNARAALISIDSDIKSYESVDWDAWEAQDLFAAQAGFRKFQQLQAARGQVTGYLDERQKARTDQTTQETAQRLQATRTYAEKQIKGWTPEVDAKITEFATKELGFDWNTLKSAYTPAVYKALHLAWLGHQAINAKTAPTTQKTPVTEPLKVVAAKANPPAKKNLADMEMDEYVAARRAGRG